MSSSAIDQILQIKPQARAANEPNQPTASDRPAFKDHLERATTESLPPEKFESSGTNQEDITASNNQREDSSSHEDETLVTVESSVAGEEETELSNEIEQDEVEISEIAIVLDGIQDSTENEIIVSQELPSHVEAESESSESEEGSEEVATTVLDIRDSESFDKPPVPTEPQSELATAELEGESSEVADSPENTTEKIAQPKAIETTTQNTTDEVVVASQQQAATTTENKAESTQVAQPEQTNSKEQSVEQAVQANAQTSSETKEKGSDSSADRRKSKHGSNPQPTVAEATSTKVLEETSTLAAENRTTAAASTPQPESTAPATPTPSNLGLESTNATSRTDSLSTNSQVEPPTEAEPVPTADRSRFVNRVGGAIRAAQNRDGEIRLQLRPAELGSLRIEIAVKEGVLTAQLETETSAARAILLDNLPALRERLAEQEIRIEKFDVDVRDESSQQSDNPETRERNANRTERDSRSQSQEKEQDNQTTQTIPDMAIPSTHVGSLDVSI